MFEHSTLQEAYTGALIAGKGKLLNNINVIMERSRFKTEEWVRVRFGAGVPWRRCWCVITPPDEKEYAKLQKELKKRSPYDRSPIPILKGDIKFYDTRKDGKKQKKAQPIATITDAYSAYAIYPQAKSLVDASTLLKIEGNVIVHSAPPSATEGFIFVMPEARPAVSGFEMLLRFLFPTWDTFGLYGRPGRLVASVLDSRSLMFAMPKNKHYGYLEVLDVTTLILEDGGSTWSEKNWRRRLKEATGARMNAMDDGTLARSRRGSRSSARLSFGGGIGMSGKPRVGFANDQASIRSSRSFSLNGVTRTEPPPVGHADRVPPPGAIGVQPFIPGLHPRQVSGSSEPSFGSGNPPRSDYGGPGGGSNPNSPQRNQAPFRGGPLPDRSVATAETGSSDDDRGSSPRPPMGDFEGMRDMRTPEPVSSPPAFNHGPQARPTSKAYHSPELRRANSRLSSSTLAQMAKAGGISSSPMAGREGPMAVRAADEDGGLAGPPPADGYGYSGGNAASSKEYGIGEAIAMPRYNGPPPNRSVGHLPPPPLVIPNQRSDSPLRQAISGPSSPYMRAPDSPARPSTSDGRYSPRPPRGPVPQPWQPSQQHPDAAYRADAPPESPQGTRLGEAFSPQRNAMAGPKMMQKGYQEYLGNGEAHRGPNAMTRSPGRAPRPLSMEMPNRKPVPSQPPNHVSTSEIIDNYASSPREGDSMPMERRRRPQELRQEPGYGRGGGYPEGGMEPLERNAAKQGDDERRSLERPRAGVLKSVGGGEAGPLRRGGEFEIPDVDFGPTVNYGSASVARKMGPAQAEVVMLHQTRRQPMAEARPMLEPPSGPQADYARPSSEGRGAQRPMAWQPGASQVGGGMAPGLSAEEYVQHRAALSPPVYRHGRNHSFGGQAGRGPRTPSPQPPHQAAGRGIRTPGSAPGPTRQGGNPWGPAPGPHWAPGGGYRPAQGGGQFPPQGHYGPDGGGLVPPGRKGGNTYQPYQGRS